MYKLPKQNLIVLKIITCVIVFFAIISSLVAGFFVVYIRTYVNGNSMYPTLNSTYEQTNKRDIVYINRFAKVDIGDVVVLDLRKHPNFDNDYAIKRLIAKSGDIVNIEFDEQQLIYNLIVNGNVIQSKEHKLFGYNTYSCFKQYVESHQLDSSRISKNDQGEIEGVIIKSGEIFVLGDNWDTSKDSSLVGPIKESAIVGRVDIVIKSTQNEFLSIIKRIF